MYPKSNYFVASVEILLNIILEKYYLNNCVTIITETPINLKVPKSSVKFSPNNDLFTYLLNSSEMGCQDYLIQTENPQKIMSALEEVTHLSTPRRSDRKVLLFCYENHRNCKKDLLGVLNEKITKFLPNIILIYPTDNHLNTLDIVSQKYIGKNENTPEALILDQWDMGKNEFVKNRNLFPHDISNLNGKTVKVACFTYKPYVLLDLNKEISPQGRDGIEMRIIEEFCVWVNCTLEVVRDDEHEWGEIYENRTGVGVLGNVLEDKADFGFAALYSWYEEFVQLDFSASCVKTSITCIAPAPRLLSNWRTPFLPFSAYMWLAIIATLVISSVALIVAQGFSADKILLTTFGALITQSLPEKTKSWRIRSVTIWLILMGFIIDNAYSGGLASTFTVPIYEQSIDTIKDIIDRDMEWGATHDAWIFSIILSEDDMIKKLLKLFRTYSFDELKRKSFLRTMAYGIEKLPAGYFAIGEYITEEALGDMMLMSEVFYYEYSVVMMRKCSPYTEKLSQLIGRLHQSGLMLAWEQQVALKYLNYNVQLGVRISRSKREVVVEPLNQQQIMGIYLIYGVGVISSIGVFIMESLYRRIRYLRIFQ